MLFIHTNHENEILWTVGQKFPKLDSPPAQIQANGRELKEILKLIPALGEPPFSPAGSTPELRTWKGMEAVLLYTLLCYVFGNV